MGMPAVPEYSAAALRVDRVTDRKLAKTSKGRGRETAMKWKTPVIVEIAVGLEINAYACAAVK
jgi:coenzyme PQQ precursor peptide PqqA